MQALDRKFVKTYESTTTKRPFNYTATVRHKGTVIAFAMDDQQRMYYTVLNLDRDTDPTQSQADALVNSQADASLDLNFWDNEPQELRFPKEIEQVGYRAVSLQQMPLYRKGGGEITDGSTLNDEETDWFQSTTARLTADTPFQVLSDEKYVYVFRQAIAEDDLNRNIFVGAKRTAIVNRTLLLDRFVYIDGKLTQKLEVRYQRSRNKDLPASRKDALGYEDLEKKRFYEPTQELSFVANLTGGQFSVLLVPTALPDVQRWQIFAYNSASQRMDSFNIERSPDGLFNTRGTRYYTSSDPTRQKDVFERTPVDPATGEALIPIVSQDGYAESALAFDGTGSYMVIPPAKQLNFAQQDFTIELWLQVGSPANNTPECTLLEQREVTGFTYSMRYFQSGEQVGKVWVGRSDGTTQVEITSTQRINDGKFHHIALTRTTVTKENQSQEIQLQLLIDGQANPLVIDTTQVATSQSPIFVASRLGSQDYFSGVMDEVRMWQRGRSPDEIMDDVHYRLIGNEPGLVGYWRFDEGTGNHVYDQTDYVNHAQLLYVSSPNAAAEMQQLEDEIQQIEAALQITVNRNGVMNPGTFGIGNHIIKPADQITTLFNIQVPELLEVYLEWSAQPPPTFLKQPRTMTIAGGTTFRSDSQGVIDRIVVRAVAPPIVAEKQRQLKAKQALLHQRQNPLQSMWITSEAPVGEHPGVRRSSFTIADRTFSAGCSALLYYQQEQAETGYTLTEKKPIKRNARIMLAVATAPKAVVAEPKNYIAVLDFAVSRDGAIAQLPDVMQLQSLNPKAGGSQNPALDAIARLEQRIIMLKSEIAQLKPEIANLSQEQQQRSLKLQIGSVSLYWNNDPNTARQLRPQDGTLVIPGQISMYRFTVAEGFQLRFEGREQKVIGTVWDDASFSRLLPKGVHEEWVGTGRFLKDFILQAEIDPSFKNELDRLVTELAEQQFRLTAKEKDLSTSQTELNRLKAIVMNNEPLPMAFLHADNTGLTVLGSLLEFAWTPDAPVLFESVDGRLSLYFRGEANQFFAAYYNVLAGRAKFRLPTVSAAGKEGGFLQLIARTAGATMEATEITVTPSPSLIQEDLCQLTIANSILNVQEVWDRLPRDPQKLAAILSGITQPLYLGKLTRALAGNVTQLEIDGRNTTLDRGATLLVGNAQTRATVVNAGPMFEGSNGFRGNALEFDGEGDYIQLPTASALGLTNSDFTVEAWVSISDLKNPAGKDDRPILGSNGARETNKALQLLVRDGKPRMGFLENDTPSSTQLQPNTWYHLTWRYDKAKKEQAIFINGKLDKALTDRAPFVGEDTLTIGRWDKTRYFKGFIGEVCIWSEARKSSDIEQDMTRPLSEHDPKLTARWRFEYVPIGEARDSSTATLQLAARDYASDDPSRQHHGIVMGNPQLTTINNNRRIEIDAIELSDVEMNEPVYLLPYDYATHAQTISPQVAWSLQNGSRLMSVDVTQAGEAIADCQIEQPSESAISCSWFADSQGNALNFNGGTAAIAPAENPAAFAADGDCTLEAWIRPTEMDSTVSVIQQSSEQSSYQIALQPTNVQTALSFNGTSDAIIISDKAWELDLDSGDFEDESDLMGSSSTFISRSLTLEAKLYLDSDFGNGDRTFFSTEKGTFQIGIRNSMLYMQVQTSTGTKTHLAERSLSPQRWYHIACIYDANAPTGGQQLRSLIDGDLATQQPTPVGRLRLDHGDLMIGGSNRGNYFKGRIDEVRIWSQARSQSQIQADVKRRLDEQEPGLICYLRFENGVARDYSARKFNLFLTGTPQFAIGSLQNYRVLAAVGGQVQQTQEVMPCNEWSHLAAVFNQSYALQFDGQNDLVNCGTEKTLDITGDLTIEAFVQLQELNRLQMIICKGQMQYGIPYKLYLWGNKLHFAFEDEQGKLHDFGSSSETKLEANAFYRVAVTRQKYTDVNRNEDNAGSTGEVVVDVKSGYQITLSIQKATSSTTQTIGRYDTPLTARSSSKACTIGGRLTNLGNMEMFKGTIAEVRIWNTARSQADLFGKLTGNEQGLVSWWQFEENQGNIAEDSKSNNHGIRTGATWVKSPDPQASQLLLYVNGERQLTNPASLSTIEPQFAIGTLKTGNGYNQNFQGQMDEIRIWGAARTEEQIQDNLFRRLMNDFEQLIAYYDCDASKDLQERSQRRVDGKSLDLKVLQDDAFVVSTAPISNETAQVRSALAGVKTDFHTTISSAPGVQEYGDKQYDIDGNLMGVMKRCYSYIQAGKWRLITGFKVGDLEMEWIGQAQYDPQLVGFIEGAPPVPSENLTIRDANQGEIYNEVSSIELTEADRVTYTYGTSRERGIDVSLRSKVAVGIKSITSTGIGLMKNVEETGIYVGWQHQIETSGGWMDEHQVGFAKGTNRLSRLSSQGSWEDPTRILYPAMGRRYIPKNIGFALVKSKTADIFAMRLKHRQPEKRVTVALTMQPNPDIPEDWNIITFPMNPRYIKQGTLDGRIGLSSDRKDYPNASGYSSDRSYFKPIEAYNLKRQIEKEQQQLTADYLNYSTNPLTGIKNREAISKKLPVATQMNLFNTYVWTADGGLFAETQNTMDIKQEVVGGSFSLAARTGPLAEADSAIATAALRFELEALIGGHLNLTSQKTQDSESAFEVKVELDVERDISIKNLDQAKAVGKTGGLYDADGNPLRCPGKVDGYRFMTFYLKPDKEHFQDFSNKVIDRIWLEQSSDASAAALRKAIDQTNGTPWRVLHRVTYVSRVLPDIGTPGNTKTDDTLRAANIESNWELIKTLDPFVKTKIGSYPELKQAVEEAIDRYLPELDPAKADIVRYMGYYYQVFPT